MPALSTARGNRLKAVGINDFSGGLSLVPPQELAQNEVAFARDVIFSSRGGFTTRPGFRPFSGDLFDAAGDSIQVLTHVHRRDDGVHQLFAMEYASGANVKWSSGGQWFDAGWSAGTLLVGLETPTRIPTGVNGAQYLNESYFVKTTAGGNVMWDGYNPTILGFSFDNDIAAPSGLNMPQTYMIANKGDFMFVAVTSEGGTMHRDRIRWSHPGRPTSWREQDFIDIPRGNITAIVPFRDYLAVFTDDQIYGLYGESTETFQLQEISSATGTPHLSCVTASASNLFWWDWDQGVMTMGSGAPKPIFGAIRPFFERNGFDADPHSEKSFSAPPNLLWGEGKLYVNTPLNPYAHPKNLGNLFVFDPNVGNGAWTTYSGIEVYLNQYTHGCAVFPRQFLSDLVVFGDKRSPMIVNDQVQELDRNYAYDLTDKRPPNALVRTAPFAGESNSIRKRWRRPRVAIRSGSARQRIKFTYLKDYFEGAATNHNDVQLDFLNKVDGGSLIWSESIIDDNFASEDTFTWTGWSGTVHVVAGALNLDVVAAGATQQLTSIGEYLLDEVSAGATLTQPPSGTSVGSIRLFNGNEFLAFRVEAGTVTMRWRDAAAVITDLGTFAYGASADWFRWREEDDIVYFESSGDGVAWTTRTSLAYPLTTRDLKFQFEATVPAAGSQTHIWDNAFFSGVGATEWDTNDWAGLLADPDEELPDNWIAFETLPSAGAGNAFAMEFASVFTDGEPLTDETTNRSWGIDSIVLPYREKGIR